MGMYPGGNIITITPTISGTAYDAGDVLFLTTEIPNAVSSRGGVSKLLSVTMIHQHDAADDIALVFMKNSYDLIGALSPGSSGGPAITDANVEAAEMTGIVHIDSSDNRQDLGGSGIYTTGGNQNSVGLQAPQLLQAAGGSTSVYVAGIAVDAQDYGAADDLDLVFHIEYL